MDAIIMAVAGIITLIIFIVAGVFGVWASSMSDEEREKNGLGPKGQGR